MKKFLLPMFLLMFWAFAASAEIEPGDVILTGIFNLPGYKCAVFSVTEKSDRFPQAEPWTVKEGERRGPFEVLEINPASGTVKTKINQTSLELRFPSASGTTEQERGLADPAPTIQLQNWGAVALLELYAQLTERTVLRAPLLPAVSFTLKAYATNQVEAASVLTNALKQKRIATILDGEKFVLAVTDTQVSMAVPRSTEIKPPPAKSANTNSKSSEYILPAGAINMPSANMQWVLTAYAELAGAKGFEHDAMYSQLGGMIFSLKTQTPLTKAEVIYAFDTLFAWQGFKVVPSTNDLLKVIRIP